MAERLCEQCGGPLPVWQGRGRPRKYCTECAPPKKGVYRRKSKRTYHARSGACSVEGCNRPIHAKRMCQTHYSAWYRRQNPERFARYNAERRADPLTQAERYARRRAEIERQAKRCEQCGEVFKRPPRIIDRQWETRRFCGLRCGNTWRGWQQSGLSRRQRDWGVGDTPQQRQTYRWTLKQQANGWAARWEKRRGQEDLAEFAELAKPSYGRGVQRVNGKGKRRTFIAGTCMDCEQPFVVIQGWWHGSQRCSRCTQRRWKCGDHRLRARKFGVEYEAIDPRSIFDRDGWRCQLCGRKTRPGQRPVDSRAATLDHIVPMARGGGHTENNLQCACWECNCRKGAGAANDQLRLAMTGGVGEGPMSTSTPQIFRRAAKRALLSKLK